ncbi:MAG: metallophosphoesterase, partial [Acidobacteriota bacterium]
MSSRWMHRLGRYYGWFRRPLLGGLAGLSAVLLLSSLFSAASSSMPFVSLPKGEDSDAFSFIVYGDIQGNYQNGHQALVDRMLQEDAALIVNTGDISRDGGKHYQRDFYPIVRELAERIPYFPAVGNHDVAWGNASSRNRFLNFFHKTFDDLARREDNHHLRDPASQKLWYSFVHGNVLFIILDSNLLIDEGRYRKTHGLEPYRDYLQEQLIWVRDLLNASSHDPQIRAKFVFFHHSPFVSYERKSVPILGFGGHPGHSRMVVNQTVPSKQPGETQYLLDLFRWHRVTAIFSGHEHFYERWREIIRDGDRPNHMLNWVVTGLGGVKPRGQPDYKEEKIDRLLEADG